MPLRRAHASIPQAAVPDPEAHEGLLAQDTSERPAPPPQRSFVSPELRRRTARLVELVLDGRLVAQVTGDDVTLYEAIDPETGQQDITLTSDGSVEIRSDLRYLNRDHQDLDGRLLVRRRGAPDPVQSVAFGGAAGQARPAPWRPDPSGSGGRR